MTRLEKLESAVYRFCLNVPAFAEERTSIFQKKIRSRPSRRANSKNWMTNSSFRFSVSSWYSLSRTWRGAGSRFWSARRAWHPGRAQFNRRRAVYLRAILGARSPIKPDAFAIGAPSPVKVASYFDFRGQRIELVAPRQVRRLAGNLLRRFELPSLGMRRRELARFYLAIFSSGVTRSGVLGTCSISWLARPGRLINVNASYSFPVAVRA